MINPTEAEEKAYLEVVRRKLAGALEDLGGWVRRYAQEIQEQKTYLWENKGDMDHVEKVSARQSAHQTVLIGEMAQAVRNRLGKLIQSPYFGRFDFLRQEAATTPMPVYVGLHAFSDEKDGKHLIFDWRAPIATLFYDYETGMGCTTISSACSPWMRNSTWRTILPFGNCWSASSPMCSA